MDVSGLARLVHRLVQVSDPVRELDMALARLSSWNTCPTFVLVIDCLRGLRLHHLIVDYLVLR